MSSQRPIEQVTLYISPDEKKEIQAWAEAEDRSVSYLLRSIVLKALQERQNRQKS